MRTANFNIIKNEPKYMAVLNEVKHLTDEEMMERELEELSSMTDDEVMNNYSCDSKEDAAEFIKDFWVA